MPNAKRLKSGSAAKSKAAAPKEQDPTDGRPTPAEVEEEEHQFVQIARKNWLKSTRKNAQVRVKNDVLKQSIWEVLEREGFQHKSLVLLESLQTLERCVQAEIRPRFLILTIRIAICGLDTQRKLPTFMFCSWP